MISSRFYFQVFFFRNFFFQDVRALFFKVFYKFLFSATLRYAQDNPIPGIEEGDLPEIRLDEVTIEKLGEAAQGALDIIKKEMKAQRLADSFGPHGWRTVKGIVEKNCFLAEG